MASSIASMTMPLSISFSRATASATAMSSALLAEATGAVPAAGLVAMSVFLGRLFGFVDFVGAFGRQRRGGGDQPVGHYQLRGGDRSERNRHRPLHGHVDQNALALGADQRAGEDLAPVELLGEHDPRLM